MRGAPPARDGRKRSRVRKRLAWAGGIAALLYAGILAATSLHADEEDEEEIVYRRVPVAKIRAEWAKTHPAKALNRTAKHVDSQVPPRFQKRFFSQPTHAHVGEALVARGWHRAETPEAAELVWFQRKQLIDWARVPRWQLVNHVRRERELGHKQRLWTRLKGTPAARWVPETYDLSTDDGVDAFVAIARNETPPTKGAPPRWLVKHPGRDGGNGIELVATGRDALGADGRVREAYEDLLAQRYVSNLLLTPDGRKFDLRVYWLVASFKPELVLYVDGTLRVSGSAFVADAGKSAHLTNAAQQAGGHDSSDESTRRSMAELRAQLTKEQRPGWPRDPAAHVDCEIRRAIQAVWRAYEPADKIYGRHEGTHHLLEPHETHDAYILLGADLMIDDKLNVWLSEIQSGCGLPTNTKAVRDVVEKMVPDLLDVVLAVKSAPFHESPPHAAAIQLAEARGMEVLANGGLTPTPEACLVGWGERTG